MMNYKMKITKSMIVFAISAAVSAQPPKPPAEAFEACANRSNGQVCQVVTAHGEMTGSCRIPPEQDQLVCVPSGHHTGDDRDQKIENASAAN